MQSMLDIEHGGMNEVFADAYQMTGNKKYMEAAKRFSHLMLLNAMAEDNDNLDNRHANTQVPKAIGFQRIGELDNNLKFINLGSSAALHFPEGAERQKNLDDAKRFIDLAQQLNCPYIRVFPNDFPKDQDKNLTKDLIAKGLLELGNYANSTNVSVLMETHGQVVYTADLLDIMKASTHKHVGLIWDAYNMWSVTKESPADVYAYLKNYIRHTHIKDAKEIDGKERYVLLGTGNSPIFEAVDLLAKNNYTGYYSFEWEKLWHPEIDAPEIAIADYPKAMQQHFAALNL